MVARFILEDALHRDSTMRISLVTHLGVCFAELVSNSSQATDSFEEDALFLVILPGLWPRAFSNRTWKWGKPPPPLERFGSLKVRNSLFLAKFRSSVSEPRRLAFTSCPLSAWSSSPSLWVSAKSGWRTSVLEHLGKKYFGSIHESVSVLPLISSKNCLEWAVLSWLLFFLDTQFSICLGATLLTLVCSSTIFIETNVHYHSWKYSHWGHACRGRIKADMFAMVLLQVLYDRVPASWVWICCRIDVPGIWGHVLRAAQRICTGILLSVLTLLKKKWISSQEAAIPFTAQKRTNSSEKYISWRPFFLWIADFWDNVHHAVGTSDQQHRRAQW